MKTLEIFWSKHSIFMQAFKSIRIDGKQNQPTIPIVLTKKKTKVLLNTQTKTSDTQKSNKKTS